MRTTVDIPDPLYRKLKAKAAKESTTEKQIIMLSVEKELQTRARKKGRIQLPIVKSKKPGTLHLTNEEIYEIIPFP